VWSRILSSTERGPVLRVQGYLQSGAAGAPGGINA
jgi:hypothetical protein